MAVQEPQFRDQRGFDLTAVKHAHDAALRHHDGDGAKALGHRGSGQVPASESKRQVDLLDRRIEIATGRHDCARSRDHEGTIELCEFLDGAAQIGIADMRPRRSVSCQGIEDECS